MKIAVVGCSHGSHNKLIVPEADAIIHTGDYSPRGTYSDAISFLRWLESQPHKHRLWVEGNHDTYAERHPVEFAALAKQYAPSCHRLFDSSIEIEGIRFFGSPYTPTFMHWSFMADRGPEIQRHWNMIPNDTQILITHGPAYGHLDLVPAEYVENGRDRHQGCADLKTTIETRLHKLKAHFFSHLHSQGNQTEVANGVTYVNAAVVGEDYRVRGDIQVVEIKP